MKIRNLQVNHLDHPIGIDGSKVRLTWSLEGGKKQTAFKVVVTDYDGKILESKVVESEVMNYTLQKAIPTRTKVNVQVCVWDEEKNKSEVSSIIIVTGIAKNEWQAKWINPELKTEPVGVRRASYLKKIETKRQCRYVRPIAHDLLSEEEKMEAARDLASLITENGNHLNTGFLTTHELSRCLSHYGQNEKAYDLLLQKESPGWLYSVTKGCTTIPESWDCYSEEGKPLSSFNHYSYGAVVGWLMDCVAGIDVTDGRITIQPYPDERLGYAKASYDSPYGKIVSEWKYVDNKVLYHVEIPTNNRALIRLHGKEEEWLEPGQYYFEG